MNALRRLSGFIPLLALMCLLPLVVTATARAQEFTFAYRVTINGSVSDWHTFGLRAGALPGVDAFDLPEPPPPPGFPFQTCFVMSEPPVGLPNRWLSEFRPTTGDNAGGVELWHVLIASPDGGANCRLEVRDLAPVSTSFDLYLIGGTGGSEALALPAVLDFAVDGASMTRFLELHFGNPIPVEPGSWGNVKALFRR